MTAGCATGDWRTASREPVGLAPDPATTTEAVIQVYGARAVRWRGYFGIHTWIAVKPSGAPGLHGVRGHRLAPALERLGAGDPCAGARRAVVRTRARVAAERRGADVDALIERIDRTAAPILRPSTGCGPVPTRTRSSPGSPPYFRSWPSTSHRRPSARTSSGNRRARPGLPKWKRLPALGYSACSGALASARSRDWR